MTCVPRILSLAVATAPHAISQDEVVRRLPRVLPDCPRSRLDHLEPVFGNAGVANRHVSVPPEWYEAEHSWPDRNRVFVDSAVALLAAAAAQALARAGLQASDVDGVITVSTSGIAAPSLDALLMDRLPFRRDLRRLPVFGLGCGGGVIGLARAADLARAAPDARLLLLVVEPCSLTLRRNDISKSNIVATALFGDGGAAAVISCTGPGPAIAAAGEYTWPGTLDVMGWGVEADGLRVIFSRDIPALIRENFRPAVDGFLTRHGYALADIDAFLCHPGGAKVLDAIAEVMGLPADALAHSRAVLRDYGNMSAVTVLFVLERALRSGGIGRRALLTALGPGFTASFTVVEAAA